RRPCASHRADVAYHTRCACHHPATAAACYAGDACTQHDSCRDCVCRCVVLACDDGNPCTDDSCAGGACIHTANAAPCNDGNACTRRDTCIAGVCTGGNAVVCTAPDQCHDAGSCDPATGTCSSPRKPDGTACDDRNACTRADACIAGVCTGAQPVGCVARDQ